MRMEGPQPAPLEPEEQAGNSYLDYIKQKREEIRAELAAKEQQTAQKETPDPQEQEEDAGQTGQRASISRKGAISFGPVQHTGEPRVDAEGSVFHPIDQQSHEYLERVRATQENARRQMEADLATRGGTTGQAGSETTPAPAQARQGQAPYPAPVVSGVSEAAPAPQVSPEEMARQEREKKDNLMLYHIVSGDRQAKEVPAGFEATPETKQAAEAFFRSKDGLLDAYKKEFIAKRNAKKSGYEHGGAATAEAVIWRENAQIEYEKKLHSLKKELLEDFIAKKHEKYPNLTKKEMQEEALKYSAGFILETAKDIDMDLEAEKNRVAYETKERGIASKLWEKYTKAPKWKKWAIGAAVAGVVGLGGALLFPSTLLFAGSAVTLSKVGVGGFLAGKAVRSVTGGALGAAVFSGIEKFHIRGKYGKKRAEAGAGQSTETLEKLKQEIGTAEDWLENEEKKMKLMAIVDADAIKYREKLDKIANKEGRSRLYAALAAGIIGGAAATAAGLDWSQVFPGGPKGAALVGALENKPSSGGIAAHEGLGGGKPGADSVSLGDELEARSGLDNPLVSPEKIISGIETAKSGDSVWQMAERQLAERVPGFKDLNEAQKTYLIDAVKDKIAENPGKFGLTNPDQLQIGQKIDFSKVFEKDSDLQDMVNKAKGLTGAQMENIERNNTTLRDWVKTHPGEALTSDKVEDILRGGGRGGTIGGDQNLDWQMERPTEPNLDWQMENPPKPGAPIAEVPKPDASIAEVPSPGGEETPPPSYGGTYGGEPDLEAKTPEAEVQEGGIQTAEIVSEYGTKMETAVAKTACLSVGEYNAIKGVTVEKLLTEIPSKDEAWAIWRGEVTGRTPGLPHDGIYGAFEYRSQIRLAEFVRSLGPSEDLQKLTVQKFLIMFGPK